jgi:hypothetical protein
MKTRTRTWKGVGLLLALAVAVLMQPVDTRAGTDWLKSGGDLLKQAAGQPTGTPATGQPSLASGEIANGLKEALQVGSARVVDRLGTADGFNADPKVHIPLPKSLQTVHEALSRVGMGGLTEDLELCLNRAAETATPKARDLLVDAISRMTIEDAQTIRKRSPDAATRYFEGKMSAPLAAEMRPVVEESLTEAGAVQAYDQAMGRYRSLPFVPDLKTDLTGHVVDGALAGIFTYLAEEEAAIRSNPAKRTTELLQKVFGAAN